MLKEILQWMTGIALLPVCAAATMAFYDQVGAVTTPGTRFSWYFFLGVGVYLFIHIFFPRLNTLYVLGHEGTHALAVWLSGGKVKRFRVSSKGGNVTATKSNLLIRLAPYLVPSYSLLVLLIFFGLSLFTSTGPWESLFFFLIGLTFCFHLLMTLEIIKTEQTDLLESGYLLSMGLIYLANLSILMVLLQTITPDLSFMDYLHNISQKTTEWYFWVYNKLSGL